MKKSTKNEYPLPRSVVLLGMMGAGKSSVGAALARLLDAPFYDADREIEASAGRTVPQIFADFGEAEFRRLERSVIARLLDGPPCVLSLGGGAFLNDETRAKINEKALSVWLRVNLPLLIERVTRHEGRPLLKNGDPAEIMTRLMNERGPIYAQAQLIVDCDDRPVTQTAQRVLDAVIKTINN